MSESAFLRFITENSILYCVFTLTERKPILSPFKDLKFKLFSSIIPLVDSMPLIYRLSGYTL